MCGDEPHELGCTVKNEDRAEGGPDGRAGAVECELERLVGALGDKERVREIPKEGDVTFDFGGGRDFGRRRVPNAAAGGGTHDRNIATRPY